MPLAMGTSPCTHWVISIQVMVLVFGESVDVKPGDGVIYYGAKYEHWREEYDGDYCSQVFFHYIILNYDYS